jgi:hypothetical protein
MRLIGNVDSMEPRLTLISCEVRPYQVSHNIYFTTHKYRFVKILPP